MKVLFLSDIHGEEGKLLKIREKAMERGVELVAALGDFLDFYDGKKLGRVLDTLSFARLMAIPGNMDEDRTIEALNERRINIHKKKAEVNGYTFIGLGGAKPVNTFYSFNMGELEAGKCLKKLMEGTAPEKTILLTHSPPAYTRIDESASGVRLGLKALREAIEEKQPLLSVSGHVHEARGTDYIGKTLCINTGALKDGSAVIVDFGKNAKQEWITV